MTPLLLPVPLIPKPMRTHHSVLDLGVPSLLDHIAEGRFVDPGGGWEGPGDGWLSELFREVA